MSTLCARRSQSQPASSVMSARSKPRLARQSMSSMHAAETFSLAAFSNRSTRLPSRQSTSRCTSMAKRCSKMSAAAAVVVASSSSARSMPSRRRARSCVNVGSLSKVFSSQW